MNRNRQRWQQLASWIIPMFYALGALALGMLLPRLEAYFFPNIVASMSASSAQAMYSSIASGMIALTGIVFSLTFVMVQFSASVYSPRLVLWVARNPLMSHALGVFTATFLYALMMLAWVDRNNSGKVPFITGWLLVGLLLASMGMFIALIGRIAFLQVNRMLIFTGGQGRKAIRELYSPAGTVPAASPALDCRALPVTQTLLHVDRPQVVQTVYVEALVKMATAAGAVIEVLPGVGATVLELTPLVRVRGALQPLPEATLRRAIQLGDDRTFEQDPKYALRLLADIAIKALSPAINDPTTAVQALDQIEDLLLLLGRCCLEIGEFRDDQGEVRLIASFPTWDDFVRLALDEILSYGADSVQVMRRMKALIKNLRRVLPAERHEALDSWEQRLQGSIARSFPDEAGKRDASVADREGLGIGKQETAEAVGQPASR